MSKKLPRCTECGHPLRDHWTAYNWKRLWLVCQHLNCKSLVCAQAVPPPAQPAEEKA